MYRIPYPIQLSRKYIYLPCERIFELPEKVSAKKRRSILLVVNPVGAGFPVQSSKICKQEACNCCGNAAILLPRSKTRLSCPHAILSLEASLSMLIMLARLSVDMKSSVRSASESTVSKRPEGVFRPDSTKHDMFGKTMLFKQMFVAL